MPSISFKAKPVKVFNMDDSLAYEYVQIPKITSSHINLDEFRRHPRFSSFSNSDLLFNIINRLLKKMGIGQKIYTSRSEILVIKTDNIPNGVTIDQSGFIWKVTINLIDNWS